MLGWVTEMAKDPCAASYLSTPPVVWPPPASQVETVSKKLATLIATTAHKESAQRAGHAATHTQ